MTLVTGKLFFSIFNKFLIPNLPFAANLENINTLENLFYWMISLFGLAVASFMYWSVVREYHKSRLKPLMSEIGVGFLLLGAGLGLFNHFLSEALSGAESGLNWGVRIAFVFILSWLAWFLFRKAKAA